MPRRFPIRGGHPVAPEHQVKNSLRQRVDEYLRDSTDNGTVFSAATAVEAERLRHLLAGAEDDLRAAQARVAGLKRSLARMDLPDRE
jgi:hypothetical protein